MGFQNIDDVLAWDQAASGWLDPRNVNAYINHVFDVERKATTMDAIMAHVKKGDNVYDELTARFGKASPEEWVNGIDDMLYGFDNVGVSETVLGAAAQDGIRMGMNPIMDEFLNTLIAKHQRNFRDVTHLFHGNVNRSNVERILNSPLLWWPLSYQIKAGKWVIDMLTNRAFGKQTDLVGTGYLNWLLQNHNERYKHDSDYADMWDNNQWMWRTLSMALPMTPFDMGVYMARWTRYSADWLAAEMGLSEKNPYYPNDLGEFLTRSTRLGPLFTADLIDHLADELTDAK